MPNGGVPMHMILHPKSDDVVILCSAGEVKVFTSEDWESDRARAQPLATLSRAEAAALAGFIRHWAGERSPTYRGPDVRSEFDW
jgi:hypothetical protein